jgi:NAD(P)-dependent dehydrogenase (short-subunit alcohol dehydrogenase family)
MSAELKDHDINVNCVLPSIIDTPDNQASMPGATCRAGWHPTRWRTWIVFLASDAARRHPWRGDPRDRARVT